MQRDRTLPRQVHGRACHDVFGDAVEPLRDEIIFAALSIRPMRRENLVGLAPQQQIEWPAEHFIDRLTEYLIHVRHHPAAQLESSRCILFRPTRCLHDSVQRHKRTRDDLSHFCPPFGRQTLTETINLWRSSITGVSANSRSSAE